MIKTLRIGNFEYGASISFWHFGFGFFFEFEKADKELDWGWSLDLTIHLGPLNINFYMWKNPI